MKKPAVAAAVPQVRATVITIETKVQPDNKTFTFDIAAQAEAASRISQVYGAWPRPGQT